MLLRFSAWNVPLPITHSLKWVKLMSPVLCILLELFMWCNFLFCLHLGRDSGTISSKKGMILLLASHKPMWSPEPSANDYFSHRFTSRQTA